MKIKDRLKDWGADNKLYNSERTINELIKKRDSYRSQFWFFFIIDIFMFVAILVSIVRFIETSIMFVISGNDLTYDYIPLLFVLVFGLIFLVFMSLRMFLVVLKINFNENFIDIMIQVKKNNIGEIKNEERIIYGDNKNRS